MKKFGRFCFLLVVLFSCGQEVESLGPCETSRWASATRNGEAICLVSPVISYWNDNTDNASIGFTAGMTDRVGVTEIEASFSIPVAGVTLDTAYPLISGKIASADEFTEGFISFITFDYPNCMAGTFELKSINSVAGITQTYTNGKFVFNLEGNVDTGCNPFK